MPTDKKYLWQYRKAKPITFGYKMVLFSLVLAGILCVFNLFNWWFREQHVASLPLYLLLTFIFWWGILRMVLLWMAYLKIKIPSPVQAPDGLKVAIFTTSSPGEPLSMFEKTLEACSNIRYPHTTYLLDDTQDPRFKDIAEKYGAVWMELVGYSGAKAGKINEALKRTHEDFILVLDPDHIPFPNFLDEVLGFFGDEKVGYVQVSQAYYNQYRSFTARGAAEQTYNFYGPTQMGLNGINCALAIGANCTFRRKALESIGGHGIGLAEDMVTAIRIHAKGWKSMYHPVIISRGLVPEDFGSFCKQQLKWARGVHEVLFAELPRCWKTLSLWQRLAYLMIGTYYFSGITMLLYILFPFIFLWSGQLPAHMDLTEFLLHWLPVVIVAVAIYLFVQRWLCHPAMERGLHWRGMFLKFACWPVFTLGFVLSLWNGKIPYIPTAKQAVKGFSFFVRPLIIQQVLFCFTLLMIVWLRKYHTHEARQALTSSLMWGMVGFAIIAFLMSLGGLYAAVQSRRLQAEEPWNRIHIEKIRIAPIKRL